MCVCVCVRVMGNGRWSDEVPRTAVWLDLSKVIHSSTIPGSVSVDSHFLIMLEKQLFSSASKNLFEG